MGHWIKQRLALIILASIAVIVLSITVAIATIQAHSSLATQQAASTPAPTTTPAGHDSAYQASGTIESIAYDANSTQSGKLLFLANTSQQAVSVVFTSQTTIALMDASGASISAPLASGLPATITGTLHADGSVTATTITAVDLNGNQNGGTQPTPSPTHPLQPTPTPKPDDGN